VVDISSGQVTQLILIRHSFGPRLSRVANVAYTRTAALPALIRYALSSTALQKIGCNAIKAVLVAKLHALATVTLHTEIARSSSDSVWFRTSGLASGNRIDRRLVYCY
jgi:hypothetical protein